jgi:hypothetical protein
MKNETRRTGWWLGWWMVGLGIPGALAAESVPLRWLGGAAPMQEAGVSWGVPWAPGEVKAQQRFALRRGDGAALPLQQWPLAYWPDGSLKWVGFATVAGAGEGELRLEPAPAPAGAVAGGAGATVAVRETANDIEVNAGRLLVRVPQRGERLIASLALDGREVARDGRLVGVVQEGPEAGPEVAVPREALATKLERVTVEQRGPVRAVLKLEGRHRGGRSGREWLPFTVRLYVHAGSASVRLVHTFVFDGDQEKDFLRGLGIAWSVPLREERQNRHVRFAGEGAGVWAEPVLPMVGRGGRFAADPASGRDVYPQQVEGRRMPDRAAYSRRAQGYLADWAAWDNYRLVQPNANGFTLEKRTDDRSAWIAAGAGQRAGGLAYVGDVSGGLAVSVRNFRQSYPGSLDITGATTDTAKLTAWLWSPEGPAMDLRHYSTRAHGLEAAYEDVQPGFSTAHGIARTSELTITACHEVPARATVAALAELGREPPLLVCAPEHYRRVRAFGYWGLPDRSTPVKRAIEERLEAALNFYLRQPEQHQWYGFWDFGDVMHSYDYDRHVWRYDLGGMAWANSELGPDMWLWLSFLRTGRKDVFRMAEAMTRHTSEVDMYHLGRFAGLGSRHNVRHWGDGAKEARISQAAYRRFHYYLTTDERTGDVMRSVANVDAQMRELDPMRLAQPATEAEKRIAPARVRLGPDWLAFAGNWMTEWERTGDGRWRDRILAGVASLDAMPLGMRQGRNLVMGYDPERATLHALNDEAGVYNLATIMGGAEVGMELGLMLDDPRWHRLWRQYCRLYQAPKETVLRDRETGTEGADAGGVRDGRLAAYVFHRDGGEAFKRVAVEALLRYARGDRRGGEGGDAPRIVRRVEPPAVLAPIDEGLGNTNSAAQSALEVFATLGLVGEHLPAELPPAPPEEPGRRGRGRGVPGAGPGPTPGVQPQTGNFDARNPAEPATPGVPRKQ